LAVGDGGAVAPAPLAGQRLGAEEDLDLLDPPYQLASGGIDQATSSVSIETSRLTSPPRIASM
jgi:hypothetical protein